MTTIQENKITDAFSINEEGFIIGMFRNLHINLTPSKLAFIFFCLTWVPLVILTAIDGTLFSNVNYPFLQDISIQGRILVGITFLILIRNPVYKEIPEVLRYIHDVILNEEDRDTFKQSATGMITARKRV